jgi:YVTN family beta-propeller protein
MPRWQRNAAHTSHFLLYACLILQPLWGYLGSTFTKYPIKYFGVTLPHWGWDSPALKDLFSALHLGTAWLLMAVLAVHIGAALKHLLVDRDGGLPAHVAGMRIAVCDYALHCARESGACAADCLCREREIRTLTLIDTARDAVVGEIKAGTKPRGMAVSADGRRLYVSDQPNNALLVIDLGKRAVESKVDLGESPEGVSLSPDGKWVAAAVEVTNSIAFVDTATGKVAFHVKTQGKNPSTRSSVRTDAGCT